MVSRKLEKALVLLARGELVGAVDVRLYGYKGAILRETRKLGKGKELEAAKLMGERVRKASLSMIISRAKRGLKVESLRCALCCDLIKRKNNDRFISRSDGERWDFCTHQCMAKWEGRTISRVEPTLVEILDFAEDYRISASVASYVLGYRKKTAAQMVWRVKKIAPLAPAIIRYNRHRWMGDKGFCKWPRKD